MNNNSLPFTTRLRLKMLRLAAASLMVVEQVFEIFWPFVFWVCIFFSLWMLQIPAIFGKTAEIILAVVFFIGAFVLLNRALFAFTLPRRNDITRRVEEDSALLHRPLSGLDDHLANPAGSRTEHLWSFWQSRLMPMLQSLRWPRLHPVLTQRDPMALRGLAVVLLITAFVIAGPTWRVRLTHGMLPVTPSFMKKDVNEVIVWITPPAYTGMGQIILKGGTTPDKKSLNVPEGSIVKAQVTGWLGRPSLHFGDTSIPMNKLSRGSYGIEKPAQAASTLSIRQSMMTRGSWPVNFLIDQPPSAEQKGEPQIQAKGVIKIPLSVKDDYGVETVTAHITLDPSVTVPPPMGLPVDDTRNVTSPPNTAMDFTPQFDLAWHPWAGLPVIMTIDVQDHKGQLAAIAPLHIKLPERQFRHPVAQKLVEMRKRLIWAPESAAINIAYDIETIMTHPQMYQGDHVIFLSLRSMASHLAYDHSVPGVANVVAQLWDTALRIEDGNFTMAQRELRNAQAALQNALRDPNTTPAEIAALMDKVRMAMGEYLKETFREMQKKMAENGADPAALKPENFMKMLNPEALAAMLDKMQAQAMSGDRNAAQQMLSQMQKLMDSLDPSTMQNEVPKDMQDMAEQISKIQEIVDKQKALLEKTKDRSATKDGQEEIRKSLNDLMQEAGEKLGKIPEPLGKAETAMRASSKELGDGKPDAAIPHQEEALKHLSDGQKQMTEQLAERMQQMMMFSFGAGPTDPLGKPMGDDGDDDGTGQGSKVKIPDQAERKKIQDILENLRKKSGELARPDYELEYYRRLMRQF